jgi:plastocyanin
VLRTRHAAAVAAVGLAGAALSGPAMASHETAAVAPQTITVKALDFRFVVSKLTIPVGTVVTFKYTNAGQVVHDFDLTTQKRKTPLLASKKTSVLKVTFSKKGRFKFICSVPRHAQLGMQGYITVK